MAPIEIRGNTVDPAAPGDVVLPSTAADTQYVLVQLKQPMDQDTLIALENKKAEVVKRMVGETWLLRYPEDDLGELEAVPAVERALVYLEDFVVHADLKNAPAAGTTGDRKAVTIALHEHAQPNEDAILAEIQNIADVEVLSSGYGYLNVEVAPADLAKIARLDSVQAIEETPRAAPYNDRILALSGINDYNEKLRKSHKPMLSGADQTVGLADSGVDTTHPAFTQAGKVVNVYYVTGDATDYDGHGTHVAGTILGSDNGIHTWENKNSTGVAPDARLLVQGGLFRQGAVWTAEDLLQKAYEVPDVNCRIHNNSWGKASLQQTNSDQHPYTRVDAERVDEWALKHPDFLIVFAAGNDGRWTTSQGGQVGAWNVAKNVLTVGASFTDRPRRANGMVDYSVQPFTFKRGVASFSSRGPVKDTKRTKPDVVAPGNGILSCRASSAADNEDFQQWPQWFGKPKDGFDVSDKTIFCSGTSMACPAVSGYAALLRQALILQGSTEPSAPLMKALLINGADTLDLPSTVQGYGEVNMQKVLAPTQPTTADIVSGRASSGYAQGTVLKQSMVTTSVKATMPNTGTKISLQVTMVYHDAPGSEIQNRMNLIIRSSEDEIETAASTPYDNVHRLLITDLKPGEEVTISVEPKLVVSAKVPWGVAWNSFAI